MIRVLGIDVPRGFAVVDVFHAGQHTGVALGELDAGREVDHAAELARKYDVQKIAIEAPLEPYVHGRGSKGNEGARRGVILSLMQCVRLAGRLEQVAISLGLPVVVEDADKVRRCLGIGGQTRSERDTLVKAYVRMRVRGWPERSNADNRDAAVVAIYGGLTK